VNATSPRNNCCHKARFAACFNSGTAVADPGAAAQASMTGACRGCLFCVRKLEAVKSLACQPINVASVLIWSGPTWQQPPMSLAPSEIQSCTRVGSKVGLPVHDRAAASQTCPLFG
jgi:hypothetical protein